MQLRIELMRVEDSHLTLPETRRAHAPGWLALWVLGLPPVALLVYVAMH